MINICLAEAVGRLESEKAAIHAEYEQVRIIRTNILGFGIPSLNREIGFESYPVVTLSCRRGLPTRSC